MLIPGYRIIRLLGEGGMAKVWLAVQEKFERDVALKIMSPLLAKHDDVYKDRFVREARIIAQLMHPNIVTIFDVGVHDDLHFIAMEYVPGRDLKQAAPTLSLRDKLTAVKQIALALHFAHQKSYVHRDIKPENILIHDDDGRAVLTDFGIARLLSSHDTLTQTGIAIGTPAFMSPEQAMGRVTDARSDIYSLGTVLFYLLCGRAPYEADSAVAIGIKHATEPVPVLPVEFTLLQPLLNRSMAKTPEQRFENGHVFAQAIDEVLTALTSSDSHATQSFATQNTAHTTMAFNVATPVTKNENEKITTPIRKINVGISRSKVNATRATVKPQISAPAPLKPVNQSTHWIARVRYSMLLMLMVSAPLLAYGLASFSLFQTTGGQTIYFTAATLVLFLGHTAAIVALALAAKKCHFEWPKPLKKVDHLQAYVMPVASLLCVYLLSASARAMVQPLIGETTYNGLFIVWLLASSVWLLSLIWPQKNIHARNNR